MQAVVADGDSAYGTWDDYTKASGFEAYDDELSYTSFAKDMVKSLCIGNQYTLIASARLEAFHHAPFQLC